MKLVNILILAFAISFTACSNDKSTSKVEAEKSNEIPQLEEDLVEEVIELDSVIENDQSEAVSASVEEIEVEKVESIDLVEKIEEVNNVETTTEVKVEENPVIVSNDDPYEAPKYFIYKDFDVLLKKHVSADGVVNYKGFKADENKLKAYLKVLAENYPQASFTINEKLAYYINLYNAATISLILENYPIKSIMDIDGGKAWDRKFVKSGDKTLSLNDIENGIIRPTFKEPRIHFAVNCAAKSCPKLLNEAFDQARLEDQFRAATSYFVNNSAKNKLSEKEIQISKIFEWYADDFKADGGVKFFIIKHSKTKVHNSAKVIYLDYDWSLNQ